jgi:hypothetical protein
MLVLVMRGAWLMLRPEGVPQCPGDQPVTPDTDTSPRE